jgi:hypothetical protein
MGALLPDSLPTRRHEPIRRPESDRRYGRASSGSCAEHPLWRPAGKEDGREPEDEDEARDDEAHSTDDGAGDSTESPCAKDRQLRRCRTRQEVRGGNAVLELLGVKPLALVHAQASEKSDVRGRSAEANAPEAGPLAGDGAEWHVLGI